MGFRLGTKPKIGKKGVAAGAGFLHAHGLSGFGVLVPSGGRRIKQAEESGGLSKEEWRELLEFVGSFEKMHGRSVEEFCTFILGAKSSEAIQKTTRPNRMKPESEKWYAAKILNRLLTLRKVMAHGDRPENAACHAFELGSLVMKAGLKFSWEPAMLHGQKFLNGPRNPGRDNLSLLLERRIKTLSARLHRPPKAREVIRELERASYEGEEPIILEIDEKRILWLCNKEREKKSTSIKSLRNRITLALKSCAPKK